MRERGSEGMLPCLYPSPVWTGATTGAAGREADARCGGRASLPGGIRVFHSAKARLEECTSTNNDVTITLSGSAAVVVRNCLLRCSPDSFAVFRAVRCQARSRLVLRANQIEGVLPLAHAHKTSSTLFGPPHADTKWL